MWVVEMDSFSGFKKKCRLAGPEQGSKKEETGGKIFFFFFFFASRYSFLVGGLVQSQQGSLSSDELPEVWEAGSY